MSSITIPRIVALAGHAGAGKDTAALALEPYGFVTESFAAPLKEMALKLNPKFWICGSWNSFRINLECTNRAEAPGPGLVKVSLLNIVETWGWEEAKRIDRVRKFLQWLGTDAVRNILGENTWVNSLEDRIESMRRDLTLGKSLTPSVVIKDARFLNEIEWVHGRGGVVLWIDRPGVGPVNDHPSDADIREHCDAVIVNESTPEILRSRVLDTLVNLANLDEDEFCLDLVTSGRSV